MKATARYGDFTGTSAADLDDIGSTILSDFLDKKGIDAKRYKPVGARFFAGSDYGNGFHAAIICIDKHGDPECTLQVMVDIAPANFMALFKRLEVVFYRAPEKHEVMPYKEVTINDLTENEK